MKSIILSVQPQWLAKILNGEKTIEIRKSAPKEFPCEVYLYCTIGKPYLNQHKGTPFEDGQLHTSYILQDCPLNFEEHTSKHLSAINLNGKVVAKFTLNKVDKVRPDRFIGLQDGFIFEGSSNLRETCLTHQELEKYLSPKMIGFALHIDDLVIFDKPMELGEFQHKPKWAVNEFSNVLETITRAPQSWQYCEVIK